MNVSICTGLILAILGGRVLTEKLVRLCADNIEACDQLLQDYEDEYRDKRFLRFGRALSGDTFFRFGKGFLRIGRSDLNPNEDKRFLRFGRTNTHSADDLLADLTYRIKEFELANNVNLRKKRSADNAEVSKLDTIAATQTESIVNNEEIRHSSVSDETGTNKGVMTIDLNPEVTSKENLLKEIGKVGNNINREEIKVIGVKQAREQEKDSEVDKRFMRIGRDPEHEEGSEVDKRFMRIGRVSYDDMENEKRFMRIGRDPDAEKRFMRIGRDPTTEESDNKRFMRIGREPDEEKQLYTYDEGNVENGKRFMRIGRGETKEEEDKRFMRIGRGNEVDTNLDDNSAINDDKRFMRIGKRFMRIGKSQKEDESRGTRCILSIDRSQNGPRQSFLRPGRSIIDKLADKRFIRFGRNIGEKDNIHMRFGK